MANADRVGEQILKKAIQKAIDNGWEKPLELEFTSNNEFLIYLTDSTPSNMKWIKFKLNEVIFNHDFAKALWGTDDVDNNGADLKTIQYWATQVAVKHLGKLHSVDDSKSVATIYDMPKINLSAPPDSLVHGTKVEYELQKLAGSIPFETHRIKEVNVYANHIPAYLWHLQQMVIDPDPIEYLGRNI